MTISSNWYAISSCKSDRVENGIFYVIVAWHGWNCDSTIPISDLNKDLHEHYSAMTLEDFLSSPKMTFIDSDDSESEEAKSSSDSDGWERCNI